MHRFRLTFIFVLSLVTAFTLSTTAASDTTVTTYPPITTIVKIPGPPRVPRADRLPLITPLKWRGSGPGVRFPDATDPTRLTSPVVQRAFQCIRFHESRDHLVDGNGGSSGEGWYQFTQQTWHSAALALGYPSRLMWDANSATADQQSAVAVWYWQRNARFGVQWSGDYYAGCYPSYLK